MAAKLILLVSLLLLISCVEEQSVKIDQSLKKSASTCNSGSVTEALADPQSIEEVVNLINALPKPLDLSCFLQSLKRPLYLNASASILSAQPAAGETNPRIFIFKGNLIISIVAAGAGSKLLEFSELKYSRRSIKGELTLPIEKSVANSDPFKKIITENKTSCSGCHTLEQEEYITEGIQVYSSIAIRPSINKDIHIDDLKYELYLCQFYRLENSRCHIYHSLLSFGEVVPQEFPADMPTFLESIRMGL